MMLAYRQCRLGCGHDAEHRAPEANRHSEVLKLASGFHVFVGDSSVRTSLATLSKLFCLDTSSVGEGDPEKRRTAIAPI